MSFIKNQGWAFAMAGSIILASLLAKNMISYPLGYDASCSYGVPLAIWETYSENGIVHSRFISGEYHVSATNIGNIGEHAVAFNLFFDAIIPLVVFFLLQKLKKENHLEVLLRKYSFVLTLLLSLSLWANIVVCWESGIHRFFYLAAVVLEILLVLAAVIKDAAYSGRGAELFRKLRGRRTQPGKQDP